MCPAAIAVLEDCFLIGELSPFMGRSFADMTPIAIIFDSRGSTKFNLLSAAEVTHFAWHPHPARESTEGRFHSTTLWWADAGSGELRGYPCNSVVWFLLLLSNMNFVLWFIYSVSLCQKVVLHKVSGIFKAHHSSFCRTLLPHPERAFGCYRQLSNEVLRALLYQNKVEGKKKEFLCALELLGALFQLTDWKSWRQHAENCAE